jgi:hypothetical protein
MPMARAAMLSFTKPILAGDHSAAFESTREALRKEGFSEAHIASFLGERLTLP